MIKKRQKKTRKLPNDPQQMGAERLARNAAEHLRTGHFKSAVTEYKELLRRESSPELIDALAAAYVGRADELAKKGMFKEAMTIWQNRSDACAKPPNDPHYLMLLLMGQGSDQAQLWLKDNLPHLAGDPQCLAGSRQLCAARILGGDEALLAPWPEDDQLRKDLPAARRALDAYCAGDDQALTAALGDIPFRSPFRELKVIFKALLDLPESPDAVSRQLGKIAQDSPFWPLAEGVRQAAARPSLKAPKATVANQEFDSFVSTLRGQDAAMLEASAELGKLIHKPSAKQLMHILAKYRKTLGEGYAWQAAARLAVNTDDLVSGALIRLFTELFGEATEFERMHYVTLTHELAQMPPLHISVSWSETLALLDEAPPHIAQDAMLARALILRRMAGHEAQHNPTSQASLKYLARALEYDPDDRDGHLQLIKLYRANGKIKPARDIATRAEARWPNDAAVLTESVHNAVDAKAFKKAGQIARKVLELDPVNSEIKGMLLDAHLAHARKQIASAKSHLASKELELAAEWATTPRAQGQLALLGGIVAFKSEELSRAKPLIAEGCAKLGELTGRFVLTLEAMGFHLDHRKLIKLGGMLLKPRQLEVPDLIATLREIELALAAKVDSANFWSAIQQFMPSLKAGAKLTLSEAEWVRACELWGRDSRLRTALLGPYAKAATKQFPKSIILSFYALDARRVIGKTMSYLDRNHMIGLHNKAQEVGDHRAVCLIDRVLDEDDRLRPNYLRFMDDDDEDYDDDYDDDDDDDFDDDDPFFMPPTLPRGAELDKAIDAMLREGIPPEFKMLMETFSTMLGTRDEREILKMIFSSLGRDAPF